MPNKDWEGFYSTCPFYKSFDNDKQYVWCEGSIPETIQAVKFFRSEGYKLHKEEYCKGKCYRYCERYRELMMKHDSE